ncbi:MAG: DNA replication/repair protein RecF [Pseudomonadota bacterium]
MSRPAGYALTRLKLRSFRNHASLTLETSAPVVVLHGPNGAGKTNILEALSFLAPGRGLRRAVSEDVRRSGSPEGSAWSVNALISAGDSETMIGTGPKPGAVGDSQSRIVRIDRSPAASVAELADYVRILWVTPAMDGLFTGPPGDRRRFLDRLVLTLDPDQGRRVNAFEKLMRDRNRLLAEDTLRGPWLDAIEMQMAENAVAIAAGRVEMVGRLAAQTTREHVSIDAGGGAFPWAELSLAGTVEQRLENATATTVEDAYRDMLAESRSLDRAAGRTLDGPHRTDFLVRHGPKAIDARLASTGEQKALLLGLILAQARLVAESVNGFAPLMLMDEIAAHLDADRRSALFDRLIALGGQAWLTGTDRSLFSAVAGRADMFQLPFETA